MERKLRKFLPHGKFVNVPAKRSRTMSAIRGKNNRTTELPLRMAFVRKGIKGWRLHAKELPGNPDFYFKNRRLAVFVDGCFWHGCPRCGHIPKTRSMFWEKKIRRNHQRDQQKRMELRQIGISTIRIWEHQLKDKPNINKVIIKISKKEKGQAGFLKGVMSGPGRT
jgi:DNA mismatch endonuclease (patch repair protein)